MDVSSNSTLSSLVSLANLNQAQAKTALSEKDLAQRSGESPDAARQAAEELESVFLNTLLESMFAGVATDGPFGGGHGESVYRSMMNEEYAKAITQNGGVGIADNIYREILTLQEVQKAPLEKQ